VGDHRFQLHNFYHNTNSILGTEYPNSATIWQSPAMRRSKDTEEILEATQEATEVA
jgi:hypothetical protein